VTVTYRQAARDDLIRQFRYYLVTLDVPRAAVRFREAVRRSAEDLKRHPSAGARYRLRHPQLRNLRFWPVAGFPALHIYYLADEDAIRVIRILHSKRNVRKILEQENIEEPEQFI
jgi:plasmid stabilization system protein ParE